MEDPDLDILAPQTGGKKKWYTQKLDARIYKELYDPKDMSLVAFAPRTLIEGLIAHGILRPGDVPVLVATLAEQCKTDIQAKCRVLESLYNQERIRDIRKLVQGELS